MVPRKYSSKTAKKNRVQTQLAAGDLARLGALRRHGETDEPLYRRVLRLGITAAESLAAVDAARRGDLSDEALLQDLIRWPRPVTARPAKSEGDPVRLTEREVLDILADLSRKSAEGTHDRLSLIEQRLSALFEVVGAIGEVHQALNRALGADDERN